ncbi:peptidase S24/S26 domain-containing protein [Serratia sp. AS12]|nr:peptidase S24/S26 domain-containing protein [Serratia plymuthica AS9]AEF50055.1 peptidase S24/S26 domain-containing protein [Serratia sp. AS12]AEG27762.1 peptidase S24/S26 domain-containing protein [Serratia sp. AS13]
MIFFYPTPNPRKFELPLFSDKVPTGFPTPPADYISSRIDLNEYYISHH